MVWGLHYPLVGYALKKVSPAAVLLLTALPVVLLAPLFLRTLRTDWQVLRALPWDARLIVLAVMVTSVAGSLLLYVSITGKNATLASLIEITYPVFVALFSYLLFRQMALTPGVVVGALLIFSGVGLIILSNP
jgi:drug/metabolite transporter (DMT)-like permease